MNCRRVERLLSDHLEDLLSPGVERAVAAHLEACPACRRCRDTLRALGADLRALAALSPPPRLAQRAIDRWATAGGLKPRTSADERGGDIPLAHRHRLRPQAAGAAVVVVALICALFLAALGRGRHIGPEVMARRDLAGGATVSGSSPHSHATEAAAAPDNPPAASARNRAGHSPRQRTALSHLAAIPPNRLPSSMLSIHGRKTQAVPIRVHPRPSAVPNPRTDDLAFLNGETTAALPRLAAVGPDADRAAAQAAAEYRREAAIVDARLFRRVTLAFKGTALSDLCDRLRAETRIALTAGRSVADEKVTLFCKEIPLRDVMRQLGRPFGYTWLRSGKENEYRYELVQDLRSQLLEEELRSRDRHAALLALDREMSAYRPYLNLTPDEALERARSAPPQEKKRLETLAGAGWGPIRIYFGLSPNELAALRAGQELAFAVEPGEAGEHPLPAELARGVLQSLRRARIMQRDGRTAVTTGGPLLEGGLPPAAVPDARATVRLRLDASELGQLALHGFSGFRVGTAGDTVAIRVGERLAMGENPAVRKPDNAAANAKLARDAALRPRVTIAPRGTAAAVPAPAPGSRTPEAPSTAPQPPRVTSADVLEALHRATSLPIVADYYTRLYSPTEVAVADLPLFEALSQVADALGMRWAKDGDWIQMRSASFFHDRLKEVPNRLLARWSASRRERGTLALEDLIEIAQLSDAQLESQRMAEGARALFGLEEWDVVRNKNLLPHLRYLSGFTPAQRQEAQSPSGLPFARMTLPQQQGFLTHGLGRRAERLVGGLEALAGASLRVEYVEAGTFEWAVPERPGELDAPDQTPRPVVRERTREGALQAARQIDPQVPESQIVPTRPRVTFTYAFGGPGGPRGMEVEAGANFFRSRSFGAPREEWRELRRREEG